jgi:hypothetical protein
MSIDERPLRGYSIPFVSIPKFSILSAIKTIAYVDKNNFLFIATLSHPHPNLKAMK